MSEKTNAWWGCRGCSERGTGEDALVRASTHRRVSGHATFWEFHSKGSYAEMKVKPPVVRPRAKPRPRQIPAHAQEARDVAEAKVRASGRVDGLTVADLMDLLGFTYHQANGMRVHWLKEGTFRMERQGRAWRVFP